MLMRGLVYIPLPSSLCEDIKRYKQLIKPSIFGPTYNPPHCTLMGGRFYEGSRDNIIKSLEEIVIEPFPIILGDTGLGKGVHSKEAIITLVVPSPELHDLHVMVITQLKPYIDHEKTPPLTKRYHKNSRREETYLMYGNPFCDEFYIPHIALTMVDRKKFRSCKHKPPRHKFLGETWEVDKFCLNTFNNGLETTISFELSPVNRQ